MSKPASVTIGRHAFSIGLAVALSAYSLSSMGCEGSGSASVTVSEASSSTSSSVSSSLSSSVFDGLVFTITGAALNLTRGVAITPVTFLQSIPSGVTCSISPELPTGLTLDASGCSISGTPTADLASTVFTVAVAHSDSSITTAPKVSFSMQVSGSIASLVFSSNTLTLTLGVAASVTPTITGTADSCVVAPSLPAGLSLNSTTCLLSGTPATLAAAASYRIFVVNDTGITATDLSITVNDVVPTLSYTGSPASGTQGSEFNSLSETLSGGTPTSCVVSPSLPAGLSIHNTTCAISGTPTTAAASNSYTVTATNSGGSTTTTVTLLIALPPPTLTSVSPSSGSLVGGTAITLTGTNFTDTVTVTLDGEACTNVVRVSGTSITCNVPGHAVGSVAVEVTNSDNQTAASTYDYVISFSQVSLLAGVLGVEGNSNGTGRNALFNRPNEVVKVGGYLYIADTQNHVIRRLDLSDNSVTTFAGSGTPGLFDGVGAAAMLYYPTGIVSDGSYLYITEPGAQQIRKIEIATATVTAIAGVPFTQGHTNNATGTSASFITPTGLAIKTDGSALYVAESYGNCIRRIALSGSYEVSDIAGDPAGSTGSGNGVGGAATFFAPNSLSYFDDAGTDTLFVADMNNSKIRKIVLAPVTFEGTVTDFAAAAAPPLSVAHNGTSLLYGSYGGGIQSLNISTAIETGIIAASSNGLLDGDSSVARFTRPAALHFNAADATQLFVSDTTDSAIRKLTFGGTITAETLAGANYPAGGLNGSTLDADGIDNNSLSETRFSTSTTQVAVLGDYAYVGDAATGIIKKISIATGVTTNLTAGGALSAITALASDGSQFLYAIDYACIKRIDTTDGSVSLIAGTGCGWGDFGYQDGIGSVAQFNSPSGLAVASDAIYIADTYNDKVRKIDLTDPDFTVSTLSLIDSVGGGAYVVSYPMALAVHGTKLYGIFGYGVTFTRISLSTNVAEDLNAALYALKFVTDGTTVYFTDSSTNGRVGMFSLADPAAITNLAGVNGDYRDVDGDLATARMYHSYGIAMGQSPTNFGIFVMGEYGLRRVW